MSKRTNRVDSISILAIKIIYYIAKGVGIASFTLKGYQIKYLPKIQLIVTVLQLLNLTVFYIFLPNMFCAAIKDRPWHSVAMTLTHIVVVSVGTVVLIASQIRGHTKVESLITRTIELFIRISDMSEETQMFAHYYYGIIFIRIASNFLRNVWEIIGTSNALVYENYALSAELCTIFLIFAGITFGEFLSLGFLTSALMYRNMGEYMKTFAKRIQFAERQILPRRMSKFRRMQFLCDCSDELDHSSEIHIFMKIMISLALVIGSVHHILASFIATGSIQWTFIIRCLSHLIDLILILLVIDMTVRNSKIAGQINFDFLFSDVDSRWDKSVERFLTQLRFECLRIEIYGLFEINCELSLRVFSVILAYTTIITQLSMMGYNIYN